MVFNNSKNRLYIVVINYIFKLIGRISTYYQSVNYLSLHSKKITTWS